jgi:hypothetical protein
MGLLFEFNFADQTYGFAIANSHFYVLEDRSLLPVRVWPAWCERCLMFMAAEQIFPVAEEAKELNEIEYFAKRPGLIPPDRHFPIRHLPELRLRKKWRASRRSPAKCLVCGSTQITSTWPGPEVEIPGRGKCVGGFRAFADMWGPPDAYYDPEGNRVAYRPSQAAAR